MYTIIVFVILLPITLFITLLLSFYTLDRKLQSKLNRFSSIDFNSFLKFEKGKLYVDGTESDSISNIALAIQQRIGSTKDEDFKIFNNIHDLTT